MATFRYRVTFDEWFVALDSILREHDLRFVVHKAYEQPRCEYHRRVTTELSHEIISTARRIFLVGTAFSREPLYLRRQSAGANAGRYFVDIARGGPAMDMGMCARFEEGGFSWFAEGDLAFQTRYWDDSLIESYPAPQELKNMFDAVQNTLQQHLLQKPIDGHVRWISPEVWKLFETGKAALGVAGKCCTIHGEVPRPKPWQKSPIHRTD